MQSRISFPENNRDKFQYLDFISLDIPLSKHREVLATPQADYIFSRYKKGKESNLIVTLNPRLGLERPFGFELKAIQEKLGDKIELMLLQFMEDQLSHKISGYTELPRAILEELRLFNVVSGARPLSFKAIEENSSVYHGFEGADAKYEVSLVNNFESFAKGKNYFFHKLEAKMPNKDLRYLSIVVEQGFDYITISADATYSDTRKRIIPTHVKNAHLSDFNLAHQVCRSACQKLVSSEYPEYAIRYLARSFDYHRNIPPREEFVREHKFVIRPRLKPKPAQQPVNESNGQSIVNKKYTPYLSIISQGKSKNIFFTIKESNRDDAVVIEITPAENRFLASFQRLLLTNKKRAQLINLMQGNDAEQKIASEIIKSRKYKVQVSQESACRPVFKDLGHVVSQNYLDKLEYFNVLKARSCQSGALNNGYNAGSDTYMTLLETLKGRGYIRISQLQRSGALPETYFPDMYIVLDNNGGGEIRLQNAWATYYYRLNEKQAESTEFLISCLKLFYESPYYLIDYFLSKDLDRDQRERQFRRTHKNIREFSNLQETLRLNFADCLYCTHIGTTKLIYLTPEISTDTSEVFNVIEHKSLPWKLDLQIKHSGLTSITIRRIDGRGIASFNLPIFSLKEAREFYIKCALEFEKINLPLFGEVETTSFYKFLENASHHKSS